MPDNLTSQAAYGAAPGVDPASIAASGLLGASAIQEAVGQAMAIAGYASARKTAAALREINADLQNAFWDDLDPIRREMLMAVGYELPPVSVDEK